MTNSVRIDESYFRTVTVDVDRIWSIKSFWKENWKWVMGIVLGIVGFLIKYLFFGERKQSSNCLRVMVTFSRA